MRIVLVDPSKSFRAALKSVLAESAVEWVEFGTVADTLGWLETRVPDMLITAKELPDGNYLDLLLRVRDKSVREYIPVYLFTSDGSRKLLAQAFAQGVTDVFEKQYVSEIAQRLKSLAFFSDIARGGRVLLVEDDPAVSLYYAKQLGKADLDVATATGSQQALKLLEKESFDLVITDLNLKDGEMGQDVLRAVRRSQGMEWRLPILVLTGSKLEQDKAGLFYLGADDYLVKPVDPRQLTVRAIQFIEKFRIQKKLREQMEAYRTRALYDNLTGAHTRYGFLETGAMVTRRCKEGGASVAVLYCDLDNFKTVNDTYGHDTGDRIIRAASQCIQSGLRGQDLLARWGGDEFVALLQYGDTSAEKSATAVAEKILSCFESRREPLLGVGCSIGLSHGQPHSMDELMALVDSADSALYESKRAGKGRLHFA